MKESKSNVYYTLVDKYDEEPQKQVDTVVECSMDSVYIMPDGYGDCCSEDGHGCPVMLEIWDGELRLVVWADINKEDPTHIISLERAKEALRLRDDIPMSINELDKLRRKIIDKVFEEADLGLQNDWEYADDDGWETVQPGNEYWRNFYYYDNPQGDGPSKKAVFTIQFKPDSTEIESAEPTY